MLCGNTTGQLIDPSGNIHMTQIVHLLTCSAELMFLSIKFILKICINLSSQSRIHYFDQAESVSSVVLAPSINSKFTWECFQEKWVYTVMWTCNIRCVPVSTFLETYRIDIYFSASKNKEVKKNTSYILTHSLFHLEVLS